MNLTFKQYFLRESDTHNWAINPTAWNQIQSNNSVAEDTVKDLPVVSAESVWGTNTPKPNSKIVKRPSAKRFVVKINRHKYLVDIGNEGSNHISFKMLVKGSLLGGEKREAEGTGRTTKWKDVRSSVPAEKVKDLKVYSATRLWAEGGKAMPNTPFKFDPPEKEFVAKIANARYLIKLGKKSSQRKISRVSSGSIGILGSTPRR